ncbi:hypothetical protein D3C86_1975090 [compost metagenome]
MVYSMSAALTGSRYASSPRLLMSCCISLRYSQICRMTFTAKTAPRQSQSSSMPSQGPIKQISWPKQATSAIR